MTEAETTFDLLTRARSGDESALDALFARHLAPLRRWASGRLPRWARDVADTHDLVQETLLRTFKRIDSFEPRSEHALQAYLRQAFMNRVRDELRRHNRRPGADPLDSQHVDAAPSPQELAIGQEAADRYEAALQTLSEAEREAIVGRVELGLTYEELAGLLGKTSADAARKAAQRALVRLAEAMSHGS